MEILKAQECLHGRLSPGSNGILIKTPPPRDGSASVHCRLPDTPSIEISILLEAWLARAPKWRVLSSGQKRAMAYTTLGEVGEVPGRAAVYLDVKRGVSKDA